jgi:hypothetical protein
LRGIFSEVPGAVLGRWSRASQVRILSIENGA